MKKYSLLVLAFVSLMLLGAGCFTTTVNVDSNANTNSNEQQNANQNNNESQTVEATLVITKESGDPVREAATINEGTTALALLRDVAGKKNIALETKTYDFGDLVQSIDGIAATNDKFWAFYINGTSATVGAGEYVVKGGDTIEFKYSQ